MNVNIGIVLRKSDREKILFPVSPRLRTWGGETVEEEGPQRFKSPALDGIEFQLFPVTKFILARLPLNEHEQMLEYAWMTGPALDTYEAWVKSNFATSEPHVFEMSLATVLKQGEFWALLFAPEGDRLGTFFSADVDSAIQELRRSTSNMSTNEGFLAVGP